MAIEWYYAQLLVIAIVAIVAAAGLIIGPNRSARARLLLGTGIGLAVVLPTMTWGYCAESRLPLGLLALLLAAPAFVALGHRLLPRSFADGAFVAAAVAVLAVFLVGQSRGCWRDESYINDATTYAVLVALPMVASWLLAWSWSQPTRATAILRQLGSLPKAARERLPRPRAESDAGAARPTPSPSQVQRANVIAQLAIVPMVGGLVFIASVLFAPVGIVVLGLAWAVRRGSRPVRACRSQWSTRGAIGLAIAALLTAGGGSWLLIWAIQEDFSFSSDASYAGLWGALAWSVVFTVLIVRSLADRHRSAEEAQSSAISSTDADSGSRQ